jgi:hypothetical protein
MQNSSILELLVRVLEGQWRVEKQVFGLQLLKM